MPPRAFVSQFRSIFIDEVYRAHLPERPRILDLGANYGLSVRYFAQMHPDAEIHAFEADPDIFAALQANTARLAGRVRLANAAAWVRDERLAFAADGLGGGTLQGARDDQFVDAVDIAAHAAEFGPFDLVKIDIEGAEHALLPHARCLLAQARHIVFEYHSVKNAPQPLGEVLCMLAELGFRTYLCAEDGLRSPFVNTLPGAFDNRLLVYAWKQLEPA